MHLEIEGHPAAADVLWETASAHGHFTAMQVRGRRTRGLELHLLRLERANRELFDSALDRDRTRWLIRHALRDVADASVRVYVFEGEEDPVTMVTVKDPGGISSPQRLQSVHYQRPDAHLKHLATGQGHYLRRARRNGFDDALLTAADGAVSESALANVGFFADSEVVWPDAPQLQGITMQLLERELAGTGVATRRSRVRVQDVVEMDGAFLTNARGIASVTRVDDRDLPESRALDALVDVYAAVPWEAI